jgi:hypothetical protein
VDFLRVAQHVFYPNPERWVSEAGQKRGKLIYEAVTRLVKAQGAAPESALAKQLFDNGHSEDEVARALAGSVQGFVVATAVSFVNVMDLWLEKGKLQRVKSLMGDLAKGDSSSGPPPGDEHPLVRALYGTLVQDPLPFLLHRRAVAAVQLGTEAIVAGDTVVVNLASASTQASGVDYLFGGKAGAGATHVCPGREMAIGVLLGVIVTLFDQTDVKRKARLTLSYRR